MQISIITAVFNNAKLVESCINSVLTQYYKNIEYIIIDGVSTDGTVEIIDRYNGKISKWLSEPDNGIYDALNKGVKIATGDIVGFLHADDIYASDRILETVVKEMISHNVDSCYGDLLYVDKDDTSKVVRYWKSCPYQDGLFLKGWMPPHPTFFVKKEIYEKYGLFNPNLGTAADYELMLRFLVRF
jgi:glycosyltransferase involved in cell wall biosynthesis